METRNLIVITPREKELYDTIGELGGWVSRNGIAKAQNKTSLSPHDFQLLDRLVDKGLIQKEIQRETETSLKRTFRYRVVPISLGGSIND